MNKITTIKKYGNGTICIYTRKVSDKTNTSIKKVTNNKDDNERRRKNKAYSAIKDLAMSYGGYKYFLTFASKKEGVRNNPKKLLDEFSKYMKEHCPDNIYIGVVQPYHVDDIYKGIFETTDYHIHVLSTDPVDLKSWSESQKCSMDFLYCKPIYTTIGNCIEYMIRNRYLLPKGMKCFRSNGIKRLPVKSVSVDENGKIVYDSEVNDVDRKELIDYFCKDEADKANKVDEADKDIKSVLNDTSKCVWIKPYDNTMQKDELFEYINRIAGIGITEHLYLTCIAEVNDCLYAGVLFSESINNSLDYEMINSFADVIIDDDKCNYYKERANKICMWNIYNTDDY